MRLRRNSDDVASASADPTTAPAPRSARSGSQPAASDISSIGVAIMPGMPLPDWVTTASVAAPAVANAPAMADVPGAADQFPAAAGGYPQVDPAFEAALAARQAAPVESTWGETPSFEAPVPASPQVDPAYEAVLAGASASPAAAAAPAGVPAPAAELPAPDPAQWSEHPNGTVVWGPVPSPVTPAPAIPFPVQSPVEAGITAAAPVPAAANALAFAAPPSGPAFSFDPPDDGADLEAPDLQAPTTPPAEPVVPDLGPEAWAGFELPATDAAPDEPEADLEPITFDITPDDAQPAAEAEPVPAVAPDATADWPAFRGADAPAPTAAPESTPAPAEASAVQPWFVTDLPEDQPPAPAGGAGQYGWLFQPDESPQQEPGAGVFGSATAWFDPGSTSTPDASPEAAWGATATTVPVQWSEEPAAEPGEADWMAAPELPLAAVVAGSAGATADSQLASPGAPPAPSPADPGVPVVPAPNPQPSVSTTTPGIVEPVTAPPPLGIVPVQPAPRIETLAPPAVAAPVARVAVAPSPPLPAPAAPTVQAPPPPPAAGPPQTRPGRSRRWLVIAAIGALVAALALVALYVYPGFLKSADPVSAAPTIVTPATAGDLTRTAKVDAPVAAAFRRAAAALGASPSSKYATYSSGQGESATVWDSNGSSDSPAATMRAYESAGGEGLGRLVSVPAGARGGAMACAAATATRTLCFWNGDGVLGAADVRGLARTEAGALAARMRTALEQPA